MITPIKKNSTPFVTPDAEKPDLANGPYLSFNADNGAVAYLQMTNERAIWFKQINSNGTIINITFGPECCEQIVNYLVQRLNETEQ